MVTVNTAAPLTSEDIEVFVEEAISEMAPNMLGEAILRIKFRNANPEDIERTTQYLKEHQIGKEARRVGTEQSVNSDKDPFGVPDIYETTNLVAVFPMAVYREKVAASV